jgi:hypothetical protein
MRFRFFLSLPRRVDIHVYNVSSKYTKWWFTLQVYERLASIIAMETENASLNKPAG